MKYLLQLTMVFLVSLALCTSCNSNDVDEVGDRPDVPEERPEIVPEKPGSNSQGLFQIESNLGLAPLTAVYFNCEVEEEYISWEMGYEDGRVCQFHGKSNNSESSVQFDPLQLTIEREYGSDVVYNDIVLNEVGCATSWTTSVGTQEYQCSATFNEKNQLIAIELEEGESCTLTWTDDNLTHLEMHGGVGQRPGGTCDIYYNEQPSNGLIVQAIGPTYDKFGFFAFAGLLGVASKNLPSKVVNRWDSDSNSDTTEFDYEYDEYGRVIYAKSCTNGKHTDIRRYTYAQTYRSQGLVP